MDSMEQKPVRARRTRQQILELLAQFDQAGSSVVAFCNQHQISRANFHKWKSRYKIVPQSVKPIPGFARVEVVSPMQSSALFAEVKGIRLYQPVSASYLKELTL